MRFILLVLLLLLLLPLPKSALARVAVKGEVANAWSHALSVGRVLYWPAKNAREISVSNGAVIRVIDQGPTIKITALKLGSATLRMEDEVLDIDVIPESSYRIYESLKSALEGRRGLVLSARTGKLEVSGRLLRWSDWEALARAAPPAEGGYSFTAEIDNDVAVAAKKRINVHLRAADLPSVDLRFDSGVRAIVPSEPKELRDQVAKRLAPYGIPVDVGLQQVHLAPLVRVQILVAEFKKSMSSKLGVEWEGKFAAQFAPVALAQPIPLTIHAFEREGLGKVLASPTLLCRSGKEAQFLAGGEFPIKVSSRKSSDVIWKQHGVLLKIKPLADRSGRMSIAIETEVSAIVPSDIVDGLPGLSTNRIETHFDLVGKQTIALSGLIKKESGENVAGLAGLSKLPILGPLFSSRDYMDNRSELVIFVTPEVVAAEGDTDDRP